MKHLVILCLALVVATSAAAAADKVRMSISAVDVSFLTGGLAVKRGMFVVYVDTILAIAAAYLVVGLKTDHWTFSLVRHSVLELAASFAPVTVLVFWRSGMYRGSWRVSV